MVDMSVSLRSSPILRLRRTLEHVLDSFTLKFALDLLLGAHGRWITFAGLILET